MSTGGDFARFFKAGISGFWGLIWIFDFWHILTATWTVIPKLPFVFWDLAIFLVMVCCVNLLGLWGYRCNWQINEKCSKF